MSEPANPEPSPAERRSRVRRAMLDLVDTGIHCGNCSGPCCTFRHNTMQITPLEAVDIVRHLRQTERWTDDMRERLTATVKRYDLNTLHGDGRRALRKSYTCTFHTPGPMGCSLHADHKPPGCLAFNPQRPGLTEGGDCASDLNALQEREDEHAEYEDAANAAIGLPWKKAPIPVAVLALWNFES